MTRNGDPGAWLAANWGRRHLDDSLSEALTRSRPIRVLPAFRYVSPNRRRSALSVRRPLEGIRTLEPYPRSCNWWETRGRAEWGFKGMPGGRSFSPGAPTPQMFTIA